MFYLLALVTNTEMVVASDSMDAMVFAVPNAPRCGKSNKVGDWRAVHANGETEFFLIWFFQNIKHDEYQFCFPSHFLQYQQVTMLLSSQPHWMKTNHLSPHKQQSIWLALKIYRKDEMDAMQ